VVVEFQDCRFERLLSESASSPTCRNRQDSGHPLGTFQKPVENRRKRHAHDVHALLCHRYAVKLAKALRAALEKTAIAKN
jgi:hypothetical protein